MLVGIDVGGTFTDGAVYSNNAVIAQSKQPTDVGDINKSLLAVLDDLLEKIDTTLIKRVVLSTTLITNMLVTGKGEKTALILIPGIGLPWSTYENNDICTYFLEGQIDFRGNEIVGIQNSELTKTLDDIKRQGISRVAIAGKFSNRNPAHEVIVRDYILENYPGMQVFISSEVANRLNFPRRAVTTYFTAQTYQEWNAFADEIISALKTRGIKQNIDILKADGGTITIDASRARPCETILSGPAASTMGALAISSNISNAAVIDIGGTTTDLALIIEGKPLFASKGAKIGGQLTHISSLAVRSIPLGGDSVIRVNAQNQVEVESYRIGPAACFGGKEPTVIDAFNVGRSLNIGDQSASYNKLEILARDNSIAVSELCEIVIKKTIAIISKALINMFSEWEQEPAYKVWEIVNRKKFELQTIIGIGAAAHAIIPILADNLAVDSQLHHYAPVANALGAAIARATIAVEMHFDTQNQTFVVNPGGYYGNLKNCARFQLDDAKAIAIDYLRKEAKQKGMEDLVPDAKFYLEEQFNIIRGWGQVGKIFDVGLEIEPGFVEGFKGV